jgi:hypothetical protein
MILPETWIKLGKTLGTINKKLIFCCNIINNIYNNKNNIPKIFENIYYYSFCRLTFCLDNFLCDYYSKYTIKLPNFDIYVTEVFYDLYEKNEYTEDLNFCYKTLEELINYINFVEDFFDKNNYELKKKIKNYNLYKNKYNECKNKIVEEIGKI